MEESSVKITRRRMRDENFRRIVVETLFNRLDPDVLRKIDAYLHKAIRKKRRLTATSPR